MQPMTMKERMLAVIRGDGPDRVPFVQYDSLAAPNEEIWKTLGRDNLGLLRWCSAFRFEHPGCRFITEPIHKNGIKGERIILKTPAGSLWQERWFDPTFGSSHIDRHFINKPEDYRILLAYLRNIIVVKDTTSIKKTIQDFGNDGLPLVAVLRTPFQQLWIQWVPLEELCLHLADQEESLIEVISWLADLQRRVYEVTFNASRKIEIPCVDVPDNITAPVIGEHYFRMYCLPLYRELVDMMAEHSIPVWVHMDGDLKPLWGVIGETGIRGIDSFSPPPDNDNPVGEAIRMWPETRLYINFPSSVHVAAPEIVRRTAGEILEEGGSSGRIWIQISENVPPEIWRRSFPEIVKAVHDFGRPGKGG